MKNEQAPWFAFYGEVPHHLVYPTGGVWQRVADCAQTYPDCEAFSFMGCRVTYQQMRVRVEQTAGALHLLGLLPGQTVTVCLPNCPQAVVLFYAINLAGGIANMVHPLASENEIADCIRQGDSRFIFILDSFFEKLYRVMDRTGLEKAVVTGIEDGLTPAKALLYHMTQLGKKPKIAQDSRVLRWKDFLRPDDAIKHFDPVNTSDTALILYSGGTTGSMKGIELTNGNLNALACQIVGTNPMFRPGDAMLAVMPIFHGFGLGVGIHSMLANGGRCILVPRFTVKSYAHLLCRQKCAFIAGVPSLYAALLKEKAMVHADLSALKGVFSGGDSLRAELKIKLDSFLAEHGANIQVREGYGTTECVSASCLTPVSVGRPGSIGVPFPDMDFRITKPGTLEEVPTGEEGEICLSGPTVMKGYRHAPDETNKALEQDEDGNVWLHTGDLGVMDGDGFLTFCQRIKRMIVTNGYNVYPSRLEEVIGTFPGVAECCVIGVPDPLRMQRVRAYVVPAVGHKPDDTFRLALLEHCRKSIALYAMPKEIIFREELPHTLVGKIAYRQLEAEATAEKSS